MNYFLFMSAFFFISIQASLDMDMAKEFYYYTISSVCSDNAILNWNCSYPCRNVKSLMDTRVFIFKLI